MRDYFYICTMKTATKVKTSLKKLKLRATSLKLKSAALVSQDKLRQLQVVQYYRNSIAWTRHLDHRLKVHNTAPKEIDETERKCSNCGHHYSGRVCPQCGQVGTWSRYTWKQALLNLLDIWGLGNRPMFRTLQELFVRPGYMIQDYLNGCRQFYFPPFKLVAIAVVFLIFVGWLTGVHRLSPFSYLTEIIGLNEVADWEGVKAFVESKLDSIKSVFDVSNVEITTALKSLIAAITWFMWFLSRNMLYEWLFIGAVLGICIWIAFIKVSKYNFVETYIFLTYVMAQFLLCLIPGTLLVWLKGSLASVSPFLQHCAGYAFNAYSIAVVLLLLVVFRQFYGLTWKSTIMHLLLSLLVGLALVIVIGSLITSVLQKNYDVVGTIICDTFAMALIVRGFSFANQFLRANKQSVTRVVEYSCKVAMLVILYIFKLDGIIALKPVFLNSILIVIAMMIYAPLAVSLSLLPVAVYKNYQSTWRALLALLPVVILWVAIRSL